MENKNKTKKILSIYLVLVVNDSGWVAVYKILKSKCSMEVHSQLHISLRVLSFQG